MTLRDRLQGELIDIVEWLDDSHDTMVHRFERHQNEIKYGARLVVREGQFGVFVSEGHLGDVFTPGSYALETRNLPVLSTLKGWYHGFESPFKAEVYFVSSRRFTDLKWGTKNPIMLRDAEFGPVRLRAFGTYVVRVSDPAAFIREIVGTQERFTTDDITNQLRNMIVSRFADIIGGAKIPILELAANYTEIGNFVTERIQPGFQTYGLELTKLLVENISLPAEVEEALDMRSSMGVIGDLQKYTQYQAADALKEAARNESGTAAAGMGMGMGFALAQQVGQTMAPAAVASPQPPPSQQTFFYAAINDTQAGPFDLPAVQQKIQAGEITHSTLIWCTGMQNWMPAGQAQNTQHLFVTPPPLPREP